MQSKGENKPSSIGFICFWFKTFSKSLIIIIRAVMVFALFIISLSCSSAINRGLPTGSKDFTVAVEPIVLLPIVISFVSIDDEAPLSTAYKIEEVRNVLESSIKAALVEKGIVLNSFDTTHVAKGATSEITWLHEFDFYRSVLPHGIKGEISKLGAALDYPTFLAISLKVKVGSHSTWNPMSGAITSGNSYSVLKTVLINSQNSEILWKNQALFRKVPVAESPEIITTSKMLFQSLKRKEL